MGQSAPDEPCLTPIGNGCGHSGQQEASSFLEVTRPGHQPETALLRGLEMKWTSPWHFPLPGSVSLGTLGRWAAAGVNPLLPEAASLPCPKPPPRTCLCSRPGKPASSPMRLMLPKALTQELSAWPTLLPGGSGPSRKGDFPGC